MKNAKDEGIFMPATGSLIINADDWGRDLETTERILECILKGTVSSTSAMVFMKDSDRAAAIAREKNIDVGLHLNLTTPFSAPNTAIGLIERQQRLSRFLMRRRISWVFFNPALMDTFDYVVASQLDEYRRLYDADPNRIDGHHHMHLCSNVLFAKLLPPGILVRRSYSFRKGEKNWHKRFYREILDRILARRYRLAHFFFSLQPLEPADRLLRIFALARKHLVEVGAHPAVPAEYKFLMGNEIFRHLGDLCIARGFSVPWSECLRKGDNR